MKHFIELTVAQKVSGFSVELDHHVCMCDDHDEAEWSLIDHIHSLTLNGHDLFRLEGRNLSSLIHLFIWPVFSCSWITDFSCDMWRQLQQSFSRYEDNVVHLMTREVSNSACGNRWSEHFSQLPLTGKRLLIADTDFAGEVFGMILTVW